MTESVPAGKNNQKWLKTLVILLVFLVGFGIRLFDLQDPPLDFHLIRQLRSALIARSVFYQLSPDLSPNLVQQATNLANLEIYEPPIFENLVGFTYYLAGSEQIWIARIYLALFWIVGGLALWGILKRYTSGWGILVSLTFYFFMPFSVIASRSFQPDPWMVMWILVCCYCFVKWSEQKHWKWAVLAGVSAGMALLVKIVAACFVGPMAVLVVFSTLGWKHWWKNFQVWCMAALTGIPSAAFYLIFNSQRSGDFMSFWTGSLSRMIYTTNFYADWLAMIQNLVGLFIFLVALLGICLIQHSSRWPVIGLWIGYFVYGLIFPYQFTTHEYYHLPLVALISLSLGPIIDLFLKALRQQSRLWQIAAVLIMGFAAFYCLYVSRSVMVAGDYRNEPAAWKKIGEAIPANEKFVALTSDYGMRLRYYGWRTMSAGWPTSSDAYLFSLAGKGGIDDYQTYFDHFISGYDLFVVLAFNELENQPQLKEILTQGYPILSEGDGYRIYDLRHPLKQGTE